jgi:hypothetical protein
MKGKVLRHNCGSGLFKEYHIRRQRPRTGKNVLEPLVLESNNNFKKKKKIKMSSLKKETFTCILSI